MKKKMLDDSLIACFQNYCLKAEAKTTALFERGSFLFKNATQGVINSFREEEGTIFEKYKPKMLEVVDNLLKGTLKPQEFAKSTTINYVNDDTSSSGSSKNPRINSMRTVVVFMVGGATI